jgi:hypothetical protein
MPHAGICAGGGWQQPSLPRPLRVRGVVHCVVSPQSLRRLGARLASAGLSDLRRAPTTMAARGPSGVGTYLPESHPRRLPRPAAKLKGIASKRRTSRLDRKPFCLTDCELTGSLFGAHPRVLVGETEGVGAGPPCPASSGSSSSSDHSDGGSIRCRPRVPAGGWRRDGRRMARSRVRCTAALRRRSARRGARA